jgi:hypothetical protein
VTRIELAIDELVLVGFDPGQRDKVGRAMEQALEARLRLADTPAFLRGPRRRDLVLAPDVRWTGATSSGARLAFEIGDSIVKGIAGPLEIGGHGPAGTAEIERPARQGTR